MLYNIILSIIMESTTDLIDLITVYPKYKSISNTVETCFNKCSYQCNNVFECDFTKCLEYIKQNKNLNSNEKATTTVILDVLQKIKKNLLLED